MDGPLQLHFCAKPLFFCALPQNDPCTLEFAVILIDAACLSQGLCLQDWLIFEWLETIVTCLLGLHDAKLSINLDDDGGVGQPEVTVTNPIDPQEPEPKDEEEKGGKESE